ncbi:MAG: LysR family transcriptional regulator, partial [Maribacter dokdonensis]
MTNQLEFRHLHYFLVLADTLHYREAAEKLYISQSALSQQIQRLEFILGKSL